MYRDNLDIEPLIDEIYDSENLSEEEIEKLDKELNKIFSYLLSACGIALGLTIYVLKKKFTKII